MNTKIELDNFYKEVYLLFSSKTANVKWNNIPKNSLVFVISLHLEGIQSALMFIKEDKQFEIDYYYHALWNIKRTRDLMKI